MDGPFFLGDGTRAPQFGRRLRLPGPGRVPGGRDDWLWERRPVCLRYRRRLLVGRRRFRRDHFRQDRIDGHWPRWRFKRNRWQHGDGRIDHRWLELRRTLPISLRERGLLRHRKHVHRQLMLPERSRLRRSLLRPNGYVCRPAVPADVRLHDGRMPFPVSERFVLCGWEHLHRRRMLSGEPGLRRHLLRARRELRQSAVRPVEPSDYRTACPDSPLTRRSARWPALGWPRSA